jgi:hypothetical protein
MRTLVALPLLGGCFACHDGTVAPPGDPAAFDPIATYADVAAFAGPGAKLISLDASQVRSDGTLELTTSRIPGPTVMYTFSRQLEAPPPDAPPIGAGGSVDGRWFESVQVYILEPGRWMHVTTGNSEYDYVHLGMERTPSSPEGTPPGDTVDPPACPFAGLWKEAIAHDAPAAAVADITYGKTGYYFYIPGTEVRLDFGTDCQVKAP